MSWLDTLFRRKRAERQLAAEIEFHIESRMRDLMQTGMPEVEARRRVRIEFGGPESVKDDCRDQRRGQVIEELFKDLRYALRVFAKTLPRSGLARL